MGTKQFCGIKLSHTFLGTRILFLVNVPIDVVFCIYEYIILMLHAHRNDIIFQDKNYFRDSSISTSNLTTVSWVET